ncbi:hypothetical protein C266_23171 [Pandoraea sp. SD6-2]|nr:hypothetical protein C266_23171 [Pandoraea sp. SD6-2]
MPGIAATLAFTLRQSPVGTDNAGREKSWRTPTGGGPAGASGAAGSLAPVMPVWSSSAGGAVALDALAAGADHAPNSDSATGTIHACRRREGSIIDTLVKLAMPWPRRKAAG